MSELHNHIGGMASITGSVYTQGSVGNYDMQDIFWSFVLEHRDILGKVLDALNS